MMTPSIMKRLVAGAAPLTGGMAAGFTVVSVIVTYAGPPGVVPAIEVLIPLIAKCEKPSVFAS